MTLMGRRRGVDDVDWGGVDNVDGEKERSE